MIDRLIEALGYWYTQRSIRRVVGTQGTLRSTELARRYWRD